MKVGQTFILNIDKPKSTKGKEYSVIKKVEDEDSIEYWYLNDNGKPQTLYDGEYSVINNLIEYMLYWIGIWKNADGKIGNFGHDYYACKPKDKFFDKKAFDMSYSILWLLFDTNNSGNPINDFRIDDAIDRLKAGNPNPYQFVNKKQIYIWHLIAKIAHI